MYLGLFGRTLAPGERATAHSRMLVTTETRDAALVDAYRAYIDALGKERQP
jgi:hypothetical protein